MKNKQYNLLLKSDFYNDFLYASVFQGKNKIGRGQCDTFRNVYVMFIWSINGFFYGINTMLV